MPVSRARSFAFIHVRKTAGTSIMMALRSVVADLELADRGMWDIMFAHPRRRWLAERLRRSYPINTLVDFPQWHLPANVVRALIGPREWERLFSFAFVRNPWDLVVSAYWFDQGELRNPTFHSERDRVAALRHCSTFDDFVRIYPLLEPEDLTSMISDESGRNIVNFVGRFERVQQDFDTICRCIGIPPIPLPRENQTAHKQYRQYYTPETQKLVARYFARDIAYFGYEF